MINQSIKKLIPSYFLNLLRSLRIKGVILRERLSYQKDMDSMKTFSRIYSKKIWGDSRDGEFGSSGSGSHDPIIINPYIDLIHSLSKTEGFEGLRFVDLGCGDFNIGKSIYHLSSKYIGVDVVDDLILRNQRSHSNSIVEFRCLDIVNDSLPEGDVCFLRQVLQHLSNNQIQKILRRLGSYKWVIITEHYPSSDLFTKSNIDKKTGASIRLVMGSGVYLTESPFSLDPRLISQILEVPDGWSGKYSGTIKTFMYKPNQEIVE